MEVSAGARPRPSSVPALLGAAHPGPALAVTVLAALLGSALDLTPARVALVTAAVLCGQLSIGWSNDLVDLARDRAVGRRDKPLAVGTVSPRTVTAACAVAVVLCVALSLACGLAAGLVHLGCVAAGWAYNLGLKATAWSWAPYAAAFGALPVFVWLAGDDPGLPPVWLPLAAACLGVGAHLLNVLPDIDDDDATGVRGLPHRLGARRLPWPRSWCSGPDRRSCCSARTCRPGWRSSAWWSWSPSPSSCCAGGAARRSRRRSGSPCSTRCCWW